MRYAPARSYSLVVRTALLVLATLLFAAAIESLRWPYIHDSPLMLYAGWRLAQGAVPYRDLFDMNMPGTYFAMRALGGLFGWEPLGFRVFDLLCVSTLALATFAWLRRFGPAPALAAALLFPLWYLAAGPSTSMQREFLALVPLTMALGVGESGLRPSGRFFATGLLAGAAALIKPQFLLLALPPMLHLTFAAGGTLSRAKRVLLMVAGILVPFAITFAYLAYRGGLEAFIDIATGYWPLYTHLSGSHQSIRGSERLAYLVSSTLKGLLNPYIPLAIAGLASAAGSLGPRVPGSQGPWPDGSATVGPSDLRTFGPSDPRTIALRQDHRRMVWTIAAMVVAAAL